MSSTNQSSRRVVIAGGSGTVGRHLAAALIEGGLEVDVLTRDPSRAARRLPSGARPVHWSVSASPELASVLDGAVAVVNLAGTAIGPLPWTKDRRRMIRDSRLLATSSIVGAIGMLPPARRPSTLVSASGTDVYVGQDAAPATEATPPGRDFLSRVCVEWEAAARAAEPLGVRVVILRHAFVLASDAPVLTLLALPFRLFVGGRLGSGRQWFSWIQVDDLAELYRFVIDHDDLAGVFNAASPEPCRNAEVAATLGRVLGRPSWLPTPAWAIRLALGEEATLLLGSRRAVPTRALEVGFTFRSTDLETALGSVLGHAAR